MFAADAQLWTQRTGRGLCALLSMLSCTTWPPSGLLPSVNEELSVGSWTLQRHCQPGRAGLGGRKAPRALVCTQPASFSHGEAPSGRPGFRPENCRHRQGQVCARLTVRLEHEFTAAYSPWAKSWAGGGRGCPVIRGLHSRGSWE